MALDRDRNMRVDAEQAAGSLGAAAGAGLVAGIIMVMFAMMVTWAVDDALWAPPRAIAETFVGDDYAGAGFLAEPVLIGIAIHMMFSIVFGVIYALILGAHGNRIGAPVQLVAGMLWGAVLWAVNTFLIAPLMPGGDAITPAMPDWAWLVAHLMYGAFLGLLYAGFRHNWTDVARD